jgi:hypothetical protein
VRDWTETGRLLGEFAHLQPYHFGLAKVWFSMSVRCRRPLGNVMVAFSEDFAQVSASLKLAADRA